MNNYLQRINLDSVATVTRYGFMALGIVLLIVFGGEAMSQATSWTAVAGQTL